MAFIDELKLKISAGNGGDGVVRWRHEKGKNLSGPAGGNGGNGGNVYLVATRDIHLLFKYRNQNEFSAGRGEDGKKNSLDGAKGEDLELVLPVGSVVTNTLSGKKFFLNNEGDRILLLNGGKGGRGNESFKSSTNQTPYEFTKGKTGESGDFLVELELIADIGLIGLPSAGKTSLLNSLTNAHGKTADYPFTTLEPNLGEFFGYVIADVPGLIEGASLGKGLGHKFLKHIRRTKILVHLISVENEDVIKTYNLIRNELKEFDLELIDKKELIILTKTDLISADLLSDKVEQIKKLNPKVIAISLYDDKLIKEVQDFLIKELKS